MCMCMRVFSRPRQVNRRVFRKSLRLYIVLLAKFAGPCFGVLMYLAVLYAWDQAVMSSVVNAHNDVYYAQQRRVLVRCASHTRRMCGFPSVYEAPRAWLCAQAPRIFCGRVGVWNVGRGTPWHRCRCKW
jgi:hypothetical protein